MTSIKELAYLLLDNVNGGIPTDDPRLNYRVAKAYITKTVAYHLRRKVFEEKNLSDEHYIGTPVTKTVPVKKEGDVYYVESLGESVDLGGMRSYAISSLNKVGRWSKKFVPITTQEASAQWLGLGNIPNVIQFYKDGDRLVFINGLVEDIDEVKLTQYNLLPKDDNDSVPSDIGQLALTDAIRLAIQEMSVPRDEDNNGTPS